MKNVISDKAPKQKGALRSEWNDDELRETLRMFTLRRFHVFCSLIKDSKFTWVITNKKILRIWKKQVCFVSDSDIDVCIYNMTQMDGLNYLYSQRYYLS